MWVIVRHLETDLRFSLDLKLYNPTKQVSSYNGEVSYQLNQRAVVGVRASSSDSEKPFQKGLPFAPHQAVHISINGTWLTELMHTGIKVGRPWGNSGLGAYMWPVYDTDTTQSRKKWKNKEHGIVHTHKKHAWHHSYVFMINYIYVCGYENERGKEVRSSTLCVYANN